MFLRSQTCTRPLRLSDRLVTPSHGKAQKLKATLCPALHHSVLPQDVLVLIFIYLRQAVVLRSPKLVWREGGNVRYSAVGPPIQITSVCWFWRETALSYPLLWSTIPILVESGRLLALANPRQVLYFLQLAKQVPLKLIIGTRKDLVGPGAKYEQTWTHHPLDFVAELAPRVRELAVAFQPDSDMLPILHKSPHLFSNLETLTLMGASQPRLLLGRAGFSECVNLRRVMWGFSLPSSIPPFLAKPPAGLTEVLLADNWDATLPAALVHAFLKAAKELVRFRGRISHCCPSSDPHQTPQLPLLQHDNLQVLSIIFQGPSPDASAPLIGALRTPRLDSFSFDMDWSAAFNPSEVVGWFRTNDLCSLTIFECLAGHIVRDDLLLGLQAMPLLRVFKCTGAVPGSRRLRVAAVRTEKALIDVSFLTMLATPTVFDVSLESDISRSRPSKAEMPCPVLQEIHVENAYFSGLHLDCFIKKRLYGCTRASSEYSFSAY